MSDRVSPTLVGANEPEARLRQWYATLNRTTLWPDIPEADIRTAMAEVARATAQVLNVSQVPIRLELPAGTNVRALGVAAFTSGMGPLLGTWVERKLIEADPAAEELLARHLDHGRRRSAKLLTVLARILDAFNDRNVKVTLLKGIHTAHRYFPEPGNRAGADIDLLVDPSEFAEARATLRSAGLVEKRRVSSPLRSEWVPAGPPQQVRSLELNHADNPRSIDLHLSLERQYFRGLRAGFGNHAYDNTSRFSVDGRPVMVLGQPVLVAFLALHASYNIQELQLVRLVELALVIRHDMAQGLLDWSALEELLTNTGTLRFVYPAFELVERLVPGTIDAVVRRRLVRASTRRMRRVVDAIDASAAYGIGTRSLDEKLMWARGPVELTLNVWELVWPSAEELSVSDRYRILRRRLRMILDGRASVRARSSNAANDHP